MEIFWTDFFSSRWPAYDHMPSNQGSPTAWAAYQYWYQSQPVRNWAAQQKVSNGQGSEVSSAARSPLLHIARITAWTIPRPRPWKNCLPGNQSLVPKRLGTSDLDYLQGRLEKQVSGIFHVYNKGRALWARRKGEQEAIGQQSRVCQRGLWLYSLLASIFLNVSLNVSPVCSKNIGRACPAHSFPWSMDAGKHVNPKMFHV